MTTLVEKIPTVNFHLWEPCNMRCRFCFATFQDSTKVRVPKGHMEEQDCIAVVESLARAGFKKINFAGGEPTLCPWLPTLVKTAKERGMTTSIVTNGSKITPQLLDDFDCCLDWAAVSIDTVDPDKLTATGRATRSGPMCADDYLGALELLVGRHIRVKVNTVVTALNWEEDLTDFIVRANPERWKLLQVLPVIGQNDGKVGDLTVTAEQFDRYVERNRTVESRGIRVVPESNAMMTGSYIMVDPSGRFFDNTLGQYTYSRPILEVGIEEALKEVIVDPAVFDARGGRYAW